MKCLSKASEIEFKRMIDAGKDITYASSGHFHSIANYLEMCEETAIQELPSSVNRSKLYNSDRIYSAVIWNSKLATPADYACGLLSEYCENDDIREFVRSHGFDI